MFSILSAIFFACDQGNDATTAKSEPTTQKITPTPSPTTSGSSGTVSDDTVVVTWEGGSLSYAKATEPVQGKLKQMLGDYLTEKYQLERQALDQALSEQLLEAEYKKQGLGSIEELLKKEFQTNDILLNTIHEYCDKSDINNIRLKVFRRSSLKFKKNSLDIPLDKNAATYPI